MTQLRDLLDDAVGTEPVRFSASDVHDRSGQLKARRRARRILTLTVAITVSVGAVFTVAGVAGRQRNARNSAVFTTSSGKELERLTLTEAQLRAHAGVGVPAGSLPVDSAGARLWVPRQWGLVVGGGCFSEPDGTGVVSIGALPDSTCAADANQIPQQAIAMIPTASRPSSRIYRTVHGYRIYTASGSKGDAAWKRFDVPQLGVQIALRGSATGAVLDTLAPSSREVAFAFAAHPAPGGYRDVTEGGVSVSIPPAWTVTSSADPCGSFASPPALVRVVIPAANISCKGPVVNLTSEFHDGMLLLPSSSYVPSSPGQRQIAVLRHGTTIIRIYNGHSFGNAPNVLGLVVRREGSNTACAFELGLGGDGRIAGAILGSIRMQA